LNERVVLPYIQDPTTKRGIGYPPTKILYIMSNVALNNAVSTAQLGTGITKGLTVRTNREIQENSLEILSVHPFKAWASESAGEDRAYAIGRAEEPVRISKTKNPYIVIKNVAKNANITAFCSKRVRDAIMSALEEGSPVTTGDVVNRFQLGYVKGPINTLNEATGDWEAVRGDDGEIMYEEKYMIMSQQTDDGVDHMQYD
jgi:hypothetical protein